VILIRFIEEKVIKCQMLNSKRPISGMPDIRCRLLVVGQNIQHTNNFI